MATTKVQNLSAIGTLAPGDKIVGERVPGTTGLLTVGAFDLENDTSPTLGANLSLGGYSIDSVTPTQLSYSIGVTSAIQTQMNTKAPTASPTFTGTVTLPADTAIGNASATEIGYLDGVTSAIQSQISAKAPSASPTFTGTVTLPADTAVGDVSATELAYVNGVTSAIQTQINTKSPTESPTFTGSVTLPATTSIGDVNSTELAYLDGVTSALQTQLDAKISSVSPTLTGTVTLPADTSIGEVSATEIGYLDGTTSSIQTQLGTKADTASPTFTGVVVLPSNTTIGDVSATELGYLDGVTSAIQTQISTKVNNTGNLPTSVQVTTGSLNSGTSASASTYLRGDMSWQTITAGTITGSIASGTANQLAYYNGSGTALAGLSTLPSAVQTNINQLGVIAQTITLTPVVGGSRYIVLSGGGGNTGTLTLQAGGGSAGFGGGLVMYSHSHATKPGWVTAGISAGSSGSFTVNNHGVGSGNDVFLVNEFGRITSGSQLTATSGSLTLNGSTAGLGSLLFSTVNNSGDFQNILVNASTSAARTYTLPDASGTISVLGNAVTGSGSVVLATSPTLVTPVLGVATGTSLAITKVNGTEASNAVTASGGAGVITTSALTTSAGGTYAITWTNTSISATSVVLLSWMGGTNTKNIMFKVVPTSGGATLTIYNTDLLAALDGTVIIGYVVH